MPTRPLNSPLNPRAEPPRFSMLRLSASARLAGAAAIVAALWLAVLWATH